MHDLQAETLRAVDQYWASFLSCPIAMLRPRHGFAVPHSALGAYPGIYAIAIGDGLPIVSVPPSLLDAAMHRATNWDSQSIRRSQDFAAILGNRAGQVLGPASISYCDRSTFDPPVAPGDVRPLSTTNAGDLTAVDDLRRACSAADWEAGGTTIQAGDMIGGFIRRELVALASCEQWGEQLAHISVVTHPDHRCQSLGQMVVGALASRLLLRGLVPQYRTLETNSASLRLGAKLGFVPYGMSMAIRFRVADT